jgi:putative transcriptional regulator
MKDDMFNELIASMKEGGAILRGKKKPSRTFIFEPMDVKRIRKGYKLSQSQFAALLGISLSTLQNWEQGRRSPEGPARVLLQVAAKYPKALLDVMHSTNKSRVQSA